MDIIIGIIGILLLIAFLGWLIRFIKNKVLGKNLFQHFTEIKAELKYTLSGGRRINKQIEKFENAENNVVKDEIAIKLIKKGHYYVLSYYNSQNVKEVLLKLDETTKRKLLLSTEVEDHSKLMCIDYIEDQKLLIKILKETKNKVVISGLIGKLEDESIAIKALNYHHSTDLRLPILSFIRNQEILINEIIKHPSKEIYSICMPKIDDQLKLVNTLKSDEEALKQLFMNYAKTKEVKILALSNINNANRLKKIALQVKSHDYKILVYSKLKKTPKELETLEEDTDLSFIANYLHENKILPNNVIEKYPRLQFIQFVYNEGIVSNSQRIMNSINENPTCAQIYIDYFNKNKSISQIKGKDLKNEISYRKNNILTAYNRIVDSKILLADEEQNMVNSFISFKEILSKLDSLNDLKLFIDIYVNEFGIINLKESYYHNRVFDMKWEDTKSDMGEYYQDEKIKELSEAQSKIMEGCKDISFLIYDALCKKNWWDDAVIELFLFNLAMHTVAWKEHNKNADDCKLKMLLNLKLLQISNASSSIKLFNSYKQYNLYLMTGFSNDVIDFGTPKGFI